MSELRNPRWAVLIGGTVVPAESAKVRTNTLYAADEFEIVLAANKKPLGLTWGEWASLNSIQAEIRVGFPANPSNWNLSELTPLIFGDVDQVTVDPVKGLISLSGRDLSRRFIDTKSPKKYPNLTPSQIAEQLAKEQGLKVKVTPTPGNAHAGRFYSIDKVQLSLNESQWDLLTYLAQQLGWLCYVQVDTLVFGPPVDPGENEFVITAPKHDSDVMTMELAHNLTVARGIIVKVHSWNSKQAKGFTQTAKASPNVTTNLSGRRPGLSQAAGGDAQVYNFTIPNLTAADAQDRANALRDQITKHELRVQVEMPGELNPTKGQIVRIRGSESVFDQAFYPFEVVRDMNLHDGFRMSMILKNHAPLTTS